MLTVHYLMLIYGVLALSALAAVWHNRAVRPLGYVLVIAWALSNIIHIGLAFEWRPILYPLIDLMIAIVARQIWRKTGYKIAVIATTLSLTNCIINVSYAILALEATYSIPVSLHYTHTLATNIVFGVKCLSLAIWGVADAHGWFDYISRLHGRDRGIAESHPHHEAEPK